jgi:hypothetical protein
MQPDAQTGYGRENPSPRYIARIALHKELHEQGEAARGKSSQKTYAGTNARKQAHFVKAMFERYGGRTLLDYGSGKGRQYEPAEIEGTDGVVHPDLKSYWGIDSVTCFDPGHESISTPPKERFDGVISTDVLEHCPEDDLGWILEEIFSFARTFVFANIACYPANKTLPNGENAHCTVRPVAWWQKLISEKASRHPDVRYRFNFELRESPPPPKGLGARLRALVKKPKHVERLVVFEG